MADLPPARLRQDQKIERIIGVVLQTGVLLSILVALAGAILYFGREGRHVADFRVFRGEPFDLRTLPRSSPPPSPGGGRRSFSSASSS